GRVLEGVSGVEQLVAEGDAFERAFARHLLVYALGRGTADADDALLDALAAIDACSGRMVSSRSRCQRST
ncbi:MAG: DUF1585 domain-containing protein, partial [Phycisphaerales bacterium]